MIPFSKLQFEIELLDNHAPTGLWGTRLRGGYGDVLKNELCLERELSSCTECRFFSDRSCDFPFLFKPVRSLLEDIPTGRPLGGLSNLPPPFVFKAPAAVDLELLRGSRLTFELIAFGPTLDRIMRAVESVGRLGDQGLDVRLKNGSLDKARFRLLDMRDMLAGGRSLYSVGNVSEPIVLDSKTYGQALSPRSEPGELVIEFVTPVVNFSVDCPPLRRSATGSNEGQARGIIDFFQFTRLVTNRIGLLWQVYGNDWPGQADFFRWQNALLKESKDIRVMEIELRRQSESRFSKRQNRHIPVEGFTGALRAGGDFSALLPYLLMGEVFHIGESTSYGFGSYKVAF